MFCFDISDIQGAVWRSIQCELNCLRPSSPSRHWFQLQLNYTCFFNRYNSCVSGHTRVSHLTSGPRLSCRNTAAGNWYQSSGPSWAVFKAWNLRSGHCSKWGGSHWARALALSCLHLQCMYVAENTTQNAPKLTIFRSKNFLALHTPSAVGWRTHYGTRLGETAYFLDHFKHWV